MIRILIVFAFSTLACGVRTRKHLPEVFDLPNISEVAIFADFDGCFDFTNENINRDDGKICTEKKRFGRDVLAYNSAAFFKMYNMEEPYKEQKDKLKHFLTQITEDASKVTLFCGSNRQSRSLDDAVSDNQKPDQKNGCKAKALGDPAKHQDGLHSIARSIGEAIGRVVEVNGALLADLGPDADPDMAAPKQWSAPDDGSFWSQNETRERFMKAIYNDWSLTKEEKFGIELDMKWSMIKHNMGQLKGKRASVYYFDDRSEFLMHTAKMYKQEKASWGDGYRDIKFIAVHFDYMDRIMDGLDNRFWYENVDVVPAALYETYEVSKDQDRRPQMATEIEERMTAGSRVVV